MIDLLVVADDLTGALDTGAQFARRGLQALVSWQGAPPVQADVWVLDTETRERAPDEARQRVAKMAAPLAAQAAHLYKKVDSTLRGPIGAELEALLAATGALKAVLAPAFPAQGRTTRQGRQLVHGVPLGETPFAQSCGESSIAVLLRAQTNLPVEEIKLDTVRRGAEAICAALRAATGRLLVVDAVEDADLLTIAQAAAMAGPDLLLAGSAGLAAQLPVPATAPAPAAAPVQRAASQGPILFVAGTRHPCLSGQIARLQAKAPVTVVRQVLGGLLARSEATVQERSRALAAALAEGDAVLTTEGAPQIAGAGPRIAALLAQVARHAVEQVRPGALVLTGGDVAMATCRALGAAAIALEGEIEPGIPAGRLLGGAAAGLGLITKAGGFGDDAVLCRILEQVRNGGV